MSGRRGPRWLGALVRAREAQEDAAKVRLAAAATAAERAHERVRTESARVDALQAQAPASEVDVQAFVAATAAVQSAAAVHAAANGDATRADAWLVQRDAELRQAALARHTAEELQERAHAGAAREAARAEQRDLDEAAARRRGAEGER